MAHGLSLVEEERQRSDAEHAVLLRRIAFLTEELDEVNRQLTDKVPGRPPRSRATKRLSA